MRPSNVFWAGALATACGLAAVAAADSARSPSVTGLAAYAPGYSGIVFTQIPVARTAAMKACCGANLRARFGEGGHLVLLAKDGSIRVLTPGFDSAADPAVSFDGKRILFAGKRAAGDPWNIFEMAADGSGLHQITKDRGNCRHPVYQSALFYLNDARPSYQVTFVSDAAGELNERGVETATHLYSIRFDGTGLRRLTYGISDSYDPFQMEDGRILFSSWIRDRIDLFAVHHDGTDYAAFSGSQGRRVKHMACVTPQGKAVFVESDQWPWDGAGTLGELSLRRNLHSYRAVTVPRDGLYLTPAPLPDGSILVSSRAAAAGSTHAIYRLDIKSGRRTLAFDQPGFQNIQAVVLAPRAEPDGHSSVVEDDQNGSILYGLNVYTNDLKPGWPPPGTAERLRVIEGLPRHISAHREPAADSLSGMIQQRLLGDVALDKDGSFHLAVPPNIPIRVQLEDKDGMALRTSAWIWTKNKENRGCIGCHEDGERTPENVFPLALNHRAAQLILAPERRRTVDFRRDIQPILAAKCSNQACHGGAAQPRFGPAEVRQGNTLFAQSYVSLLGKGGGAYVDAGRARTSRLVWAIFGRNTARPWDRVAPAGVPRKMPPAGSAALGDDERRAIVEWIDMGAQYNALPSDSDSGRRR